MSKALQIAAITGGVIALWVLYLYRKKKMNEDQAILWLFISLGIVVLSTWTDLLLAIGAVVEVENVTDLVTAAFVAFLLLISIFYSVKISELVERTKRLTQEVAMLKAGSEVLKERPEEKT
jgi:hypothetical protein